MMDKMTSNEFNVFSEENRELMDIEKWELLLNSGDQATVEAEIRSLIPFQRQIDELVSL